MAVEVIMPKVDMIMESGTFVEWLKQEGELVTKGDPLFVIMTDKAAMEVEAPASGILSNLKAQPDQEIPVTQTIAYILEKGESLPGEALPKPVVPVTAGRIVGISPEIAATLPAGDRRQPVPMATPAGKLRASPVARRMAAELGINLVAVSGRGPKGRIQKADVLETAQGPARQAAVNRQVAWISASPVQLPAMQILLPDARQKRIVPLAGPRRIIAQRMAYSASTAPHITLSLDVDMSEAGRLRSQTMAKIEQKTGQRLSFTAMITRAVASILPAHPYLNASLVGENIVLWDDVHLGIATSLDDYLIVPVIREAQAKNLAQIVVELSDLVERARSRRLTPKEMSGGTFTISNLGMFGIESFTAIINPPESAILAVGAIIDKYTKTSHGEAFRPTMNLTICADHRIVDGAAAARFLAELKVTLENPYLLI